MQRCTVSYIRIFVMDWRWQNAVRPLSEYPVRLLPNSYKSDMAIKFVNDSLKVIGHGTSAKLHHATP